MMTNEIAELRSVPDNEKLFEHILLSPLLMYNLSFSLL